MLIVVEGCIGAGKSIVAKGLAQKRKSAALFEQFESNPFLSAFYEDPVAHATETEFAFLLLHFHQLKVQRHAILRDETIADFHLGKDLLYANLNLNDSKARQLFSDLFELLSSQVPQPALMICLSASTELLVERIRERNRDMEMKLDSSYYAKINAAYEKFFRETSFRKIKISMDEWDFVGKPALFEKLSILIDEQLQPK